MTHDELKLRLPSLIDALVANIHDVPGLAHLNRVYMPNRDAIHQVILRLRQLLFPGFFGRQGLTTENLPARVEEHIRESADLLYEQVGWCIRYRAQMPAENGQNSPCVECDQSAAQIVSNFFDRLPAIRQLLSADVQAAFDSDPAAQSPDETIFCYPGLYAIAVQRIAHEFHELGVPLLPRIMTEAAHSETGIDIHPGAQLGRSLFIDHGTGIVIGETTTIGANVKLYQGVTLGALAPAFGQILRGKKRHPTIEDDVIIYSNATILGGQTVIGRGSVINGNVFITSSVPPYTSVSAEPPKLTYRQRKPAAVEGPDG